MSPKILLVSGLTCVLMPQLLSPQVLIAQSVRVGQPRAVEIGLQDRPLIEPHLAVHPSNPNHLLGTAMVATTDQASNAAEFARIGIERTCVTFHSLDGGATWSRHDFPLTSCFDPWVVITPEGHAVLSVLAEDPALPNQNEGMVVYHSVDGGQTWAPEPVGLGDRHDHQTMVVDVSTPGRENWLYIVSSRGMQAEETGLE